MKITVGDIAEKLGGEVIGSPGVIIRGVAGIKEAKEGDITFIANPKYYHLLEKTSASAIIISLDDEIDINKVDKTFIRTENPSLFFSQVVELFSPSQDCHPQGIHPTVVMGRDVLLGKNVRIGAYVVIEREAQIGDNTVIYSGSYIGRGVKVGKECIIYPNVSIREFVEIGNRVIIHPGTVIGADGFGFLKVGDRHKKIPQLGVVVIEDDVEIGANVTIDRARFDKTVIGKGTKIDNLVQIAHNVIIGENCIIVAQAGISGSTIVGDNAVLAGQAGVVGHITIGERAIVAAQAGVTKSVPPDTMVSGYPARPHDLAKRINACIQRLPQLYKRMKELEERVKELERKDGSKDGQ